MRTSVQKRSTAFFPLHLVVHGNWSDWSSWPNCNKPCNNGTKTRKRLCNNPEPANGGKDCEGPATESEDCNQVPCPGLSILLFPSHRRCFTKIRNLKERSGTTKGTATKM